MPLLPCSGSVWAAVLAAARAPQALPLQEDIELALHAGGQAERAAGVRQFKEFKPQWTLVHGGERRGDAGGGLVKPYWTLVHGGERREDAG